jgi:hypothetical protein
LNKQQLKFRNDLLKYINASSEPLLTSKLVKHYGYTYEATMRLLNDLERSGVIEYIIDNELVRWIPAPDSEELRTKLFLERADDETTDDGGASKVREGQAGDLRSDPVVPLPEPSH